MYHSLFIQSLVNGHLDYFYFLASMNSAAVNIHVQIFVWPFFFFSFGWIPKSGISGSCGKFMFNFLRNYQNDCTILRSHYKCMKIPFFSHS